MNSDYIDFGMVTAVVAGLTEMMKAIGFPPRFSPIVSLIFGIVGGVIYLHPDELANGVFMGIVAGLTASGFYSGAKSLVTKEEVKSDGKQS